MLAWGRGGVASAFALGRPQGLFRPVTGPGVCALARFLLPSPCPVSLTAQLLGGQCVTALVRPPRRVHTDQQTTIAPARSLGLRNLVDSVTVRAGWRAEHVVSVAHVTRAILCGGWHSLLSVSEEAEACRSGDREGPWHLNPCLSKPGVQWP